MQRRKVSGVIGLAAVGVIVAGCSSAAEEPSPIDTEAPVTITVQQQTSQEALFAAVAEAFEAEYPNVTVELETVSQEQKVGSNLAVLGSSSPPDVGMIPINSEVYTQLVAADALAPLEDVWAEADLDERYSEAVASSLKVDGVPYTVAFSQVIYNVVWLNPDVLAEVGLDVPADNRFESAEQFVEYATVLKEAGKGGFYIGGGSGYHASWMLDALLATAATQEQMDNYLTSWDPAVEVTASFTDEPFVTSLETLNEFNESGVYQDGFLGQDAPTALAPFLEGNAGMAIGGNFTTADFEAAELGFEPTWAILPPVDGGSAAALNLYFGDAMGVPAKAANVEWGKKFLEFLMTDEMQQEAVVGAAGLLPSVNSLGDDALTDLPELTQVLVQDAGENGARPGWTSTVPGGVGQQFIDPLLQQMYSGELTPAEVAEQMQAHLLEYREQNQ